MSIRLVVILCVLALIAIVFYILLGMWDSNDMQGQVLNGATTNVTDSYVLPPDAFEREIASADRVLLDVRTPDEYASGYLPNARNIDFSSAGFLEEIRSLDRTAPYAVYCRSGNRSGKAVAEMKKLGFTNIIDLKGGLLAWEREGRTVCTEC